MFPPTKQKVFKFSEALHSDSTPHCFDARPATSTLLFLFFIMLILSLAAFLFTGYSIEFWIASLFLSFSIFCLQWQALAITITHRWTAARNTALVRARMRCKARARLVCKFVCVFLVCVSADVLGLRVCLCVCLCNGD